MKAFNSRYSWLWNVATPPMRCMGTPSLRRYAMQIVPFLISLMTIFFFSFPATAGVIFSNTGTYPDSNFVLSYDNNNPPVQSNTIGNPAPSVAFTTSTTGQSNGYQISDVISDFVFETDIMFTDRYACEGFYLGFRSVDPNNYYYLKFSGRYDGGFIIMGSQNNGNPVNLAYITNQGWFENTWYRIKLVAQGSSLKAYVDDVLKIDVNDSTYTSGTTEFALGFYMPSGTVSWYLDNMKLSTIESKIAFSSDRDGNGEIYTMNPDGTNQTRLTNNFANEGKPSWSPDGSKIAFESDRDGNYEIYVMNADGTNQVRLTNNTADDSQPAWSPDGTKIAFTTNRDGNYEIYVMNADGTNPVNLTNNFTPWGSGIYYNDFDEEPRWSPDGTKIAFSSWRSGDTRVWVMNSDGSNPQQLSAVAWSSRPAWSPDGTKITYSAQGAVYVMNSDGSNQTQLLNVGCCVSPVVGSWSPDGTKMVLFSDRFDGNYEIYTINSDGTNRTRLTNNNAFDGDPSWSPILPISYPTTHSISGRVTENSVGLGNVTMTLGGYTSATTTSASDGTYSFANLADGNHTITPSLNGYTFTPASRSVTVAGTDVTGVDFTATPVSITEYITLPAGRSAGGLAYESGFLWVSQFLDGRIDVTIISKIDVSTGQVVSESPERPWNARGITVGEGYLWISDAYLDRIHKLNPQDFSDVSSFSTPGSEPTGITFDGSNLWLVDPYYQRIYKLNTSGGVISSFSIPNAYRFGLEWENGGMWTDTGNSEISYYTKDGTISTVRSLTGLPPVAWRWFDIAIGNGKVYIGIGDKIYIQNWGLAPCPVSTISGTLIDKITNKPLSGVTVTVDGIYSAVTDSSGYYSIPNPSCGSHTITVNVPGYSGYYGTVDTTQAGTLNILLTKNETVYGIQNPSGKGPDPVNTATGNYIYQKKDTEIPGRGLPVVFERNYNSQDSVDGPLGFGWTHSYNVKLTVNSDATVTIRWGDGKTETWTPDGSGRYTPQYGVFDTLIDNGDGTYTLKKKDSTQYNFDGSGGLTSIVDKNDNTVSLIYTGGNLTQITDTVGRVIAFTYDAGNHITQIADPIGRTIQFAYDANGDLISVTDRNGNTTTYTYDANHQMLTATDPLGNTFVTNIYDDQKRVVVSQKDAKQGVTVYLYDEANRKTTIIDQLGNPTIHYHDELLRLIQEEDARGNSIFYTYDSAGNRTEVKDKNGNTTKYTYDSRGNVTSKTDALSNVTTITYDTNNNPLTRTDANGNTTVFEYDPNGNLTKATNPLGNYTTITYNAYGQPLTITDSNGNITTNAYDAEGNLMEVTDPLGSKTTYTYDGVGRRLTVTDALGRSTAYTYDNNNNLLTVTDALGNVTSYTYDANNNKLTATYPMGNTTEYTYDVKDLLTTITDPLGNTLSYTYDALDRKTSVMDKNGNTAGFAYDAVGNLIEVTDPLGNKTTYTYDANGNKLTETDPVGNTASYTYDALNRVVIVTDPLGNSTTNTYDKLGKVVSTTDARNQTTSFEYDAMGRLKKATDANSGTVTYTYDANGNRLTMTDPNGNTTTYAYDALNRMTRKTEPLGGQYQYAYDAVGNMTSRIDADGDTINYAYDELNRLVEITYPDTTTISFEYDANGNRTRMVDSLGTSIYQYDVLNRLTVYINPFGKTVGYGYDASGNRTLLIYPDGKVVQYGYDALNRLTSVEDWLGERTTYSYDATGRLTGTVNANDTTEAYSYDAGGRLTDLTNAKGDSTIISSYTYTIDAIGNHSQVVQDEPLQPIITGQELTYTYDAENRMTGVGGVINNFDPNGNMTAKGSDTFTYDYNDRLIQSNIGGVVTQYSYDGLGNRLAKVEGGTTTRYVLDINGSLSNVLAEMNGVGNITAYYVHGLGLISKVLPDGTVYYYHYDSRGSTIALTDASQNITDAYAYDPFGRLSNSTGTTANPFRYVGRYGVMEEGNGLQYIRARYYIPELGRFITKDPLTGKDGDSQSLNRYVYVKNNPLLLIDPSGFLYKEQYLGLEAILEYEKETNNSWLTAARIAYESPLSIYDESLTSILWGKDWSGRKEKILKDNEFFIELLMEDEEGQGGQGNPIPTSLGFDIDFDWYVVLRWASFGSGPVAGFQLKPGKILDTCRDFLYYGCWDLEPVTEREKNALLLIEKGYRFSDIWTPEFMEDQRKKIYKK